MKKRVVITGMGVVSPLGVGLQDFQKAIQEGRRGFEKIERLEELGFSCQLGGIPAISESLISKYFTNLQLRNFNSSGILYGVIAGMDAMNDADFPLTEKDQPNYDLGIIFGTGISGVEKFREAIYKIDEGKVRRLGSTSVVQTMTSGTSAYLGGMIGAGNLVTANSSACSTGTEAMLMGYERIVQGKATAMLCGSSSDHGPYIWGGFDAMKVLEYRYNSDAELTPGPMQEDVKGFVPGSGAGAYFLEEYEHAKARGASIYAEVLGGAITNGGQRNGGSLTAPNGEAVIRCIRMALKEAGVTGEAIDYINGHLTGTIKDPFEIQNWVSALDRKGKDFPYINSLKGMTGHCLAASGSIELIAAVLQLQNQFIFPNVNVHPIHPEILSEIDVSRIPTEVIKAPLKTIIKASFGFGDVNACVVLSKV